jgi:hypothetical protein
MEDEICLFDKFGYCKYKKECRKRHFSEECQELSNCKSIKPAPKDTPKPAQDINLVNVDLKNVPTNIRSHT